MSAHDAKAASTVRARTLSRNDELRQRRRESLRVSLQLRSLKLAKRAFDASSPTLRPQLRRDLSRSVSNNSGKRLLEGKDEDEKRSGIHNDYSQLLLPQITKDHFRFVGGDTWFEITDPDKQAALGTKFFSCAKDRAKADVLPPDLAVFDGGLLPVAVLRTEVRRRDQERLHVTSKINAAVDLLMDKLMNDEFASSVLSKEKDVKKQQRESVVTEEEEKRIFTKGMFHYFDNDHSHCIDGAEFRQGIRMLAEDARKMVLCASEPNTSYKERARERAVAEACAMAADQLTDGDLNNVFKVIAGDDNETSMDEFVAFYLSTGVEPSQGGYSDDLTNKIKVVWNLLQESEHLLEKHGVLDEVAAENHLVEQTYVGMRDRAIETFRNRNPPYTKEPIPLSIMPEEYLKDLLIKEEELRQREAALQRLLEGFSDDEEHEEEAGTFSQPEIAAERPQMTRIRSKLNPSAAETAVVEQGPAANELLQRARDEQRDAAQEAAWQHKLETLSGTIFCGHDNTDMDSVASALACAELYGGTAARATDKLNNEITTCLDHWGMEQPPLFKDIPGVVNRSVCLVDHQQTTQFTAGLREDQVCGIIDHHSLKTHTVCTAGPIYIDIRPWGSACTMIAFDYFQMRRVPSKPVAGMLLSGILSDTLNLMGPTTTNPDRVMVAALAQVAEVDDVNELARTQFRAKSAELGMMTDTEIVLGDHKVFEFSSSERPPFNVGFGVCECIAPAHAALLERAVGLREEVAALKAEKSLEYSFFAIVDIANLRSHLIVCGPAEAEVAIAAFGGEIVDSVMDLGNRVSRKNDFIKNGINPVLSNPDFQLTQPARQASREQQTAPVSPLAMDPHLGDDGRVTREKRLKCVTSHIEWLFCVSSPCCFSRLDCFDVSPLHVVMVTGVDVCCDFAGLSVAARAVMEANRLGRVADHTSQPGAAPVSTVAGSLGTVQARRDSIGIGATALDTHTMRVLQRVGIGIGLVLLGAAVGRITRRV